MPYIGNQPSESFTSFATQEFSTSATTSYTLDHAVTNENEIALFVNNVRQQPGSGKAYTASGTALTLSAATASTDTMYCVFLGRALQTVTPATNSITAAMVGNDLISGKTALASEPADTDEFLVSDAGTLKRIDYSLIKSGLTLIKSVTASGAASVEFKNGTSDVVLDSTYAIYKVFGFNITAATDDTNINIQFSTDAGSSYITSGYYTMTQRNIDGTINTGLTATSVAMDYNNLGNSTNEEGAFEFTLFNPSSGSHFTHYQSTGTSRNNNGAVVFYESGGIYEATSDIDAFRIFQSSGNISGTFKLYGIT